MDGERYGPKAYPRNAQYVGKITWLILEGFYLLMIFYSVIPVAIAIINTSKGRRPQKSQLKDGIHQAGLENESL